MEACRELAAFHQERCSDVALLYARRGFRPETLRREEDLAQLPFVLSAAMKRFPLWSLPRESAEVENLSWGTGGVPTRVWWDPGSAARRNRLHRALIEQSDLADPRPARHLMFSHRPRGQGEEVTVAITLETLRSIAPSGETFWALERGGDGRLTLRLEQALQMLRRYADGDVPVRLTGLPAFILDALSKLPAPLLLPAGSRVITAGGWKASEAAMSRSDFRREASRLLGVPETGIRDGYGMTEHGVFYLECAAHRFHVPAHSRVLVRDPMSLKPLASGVPGLLELVTPVNAAMPFLALLSLDIGRLLPAPCPCGHPSPTFAVDGRARDTEARGCAARMEELASGS